MFKSYKKDTGAGSKPGSASSKPGVTSAAGGSSSATKTRPPSAGTGKAKSGTGARPASGKVSATATPLAVSVTKAPIVGANTGTAEKKPSDTAQRKASATGERKASATGQRKTSAAGERKASATGVKKPTTTPVSATGRPMSTSKSTSATGRPASASKKNQSAPANVAKPLPKFDNNSAGKVTPSAGASKDMEVLRSWLINGTSNGTFVIEDSYHKKDPLMLKTLEELAVNGKGVAAVAVLKKSNDHHLAKKHNLVFSLAFFSRQTDDLAAKSAAYQLVNAVCTTSERLFIFVHYCERLSGKKSGWGRGHKKAIAGWYLQHQQHPENLLHLTAFPASWKQWKHVDILRLAHLKPDGPIAPVLRFLAKGSESTQKYYAKDADKMKAEFDCMEAIEELKSTKDSTRAAAIIEKYQFGLDAVPTDLSTDKTIWGILFKKLPLKESLPRVQSLLSKNSEAIQANIKVLLDKVRDKEQIKQCHPFSIMATFCRGQIIPGMAFLPPELENALKEALKLRLGAVERTQLKVLLAYGPHQITGKLGEVKGTSIVSAQQAKGTLGLYLSRLAGELSLLPYLGTMETESWFAPESVGGEALATLTDVRAGAMELIKVYKPPRRPTQPTLHEYDIAQPAIWAAAKSNKYDVIVVINDKKPAEGKVSRINAVRDYREKVNSPSARIITVNLVDSETFAGEQDVSDKNILDVEGFNAEIAMLFDEFILCKI